MAEAITFGGKVAVVTGAGRGLGRAYAIDLARRGARVVVNDIGVSIAGEGFSQAPAEEVVAEIKSFGGDAVSNFDDISQPGKSGPVNQAIVDFGTVDIVVNNAGRLEHHAFEDLPWQSFLEMQQVHYFGTFHTSQAAYKVMREKGYGRIVMTSSQVGFYGKSGSTSYGGAKMGVLGLLLTLALEAPEHGIHVNAISPFAGTRMSAGAFPANVVPLIAPEQVSAAVSYLCSDRCQRSGDIIVAGGGHFSAVQMVEAPGIDFDDFSSITAEEIESRYAEIVDASTTVRFDNALQAVGKTFDRILEIAGRSENGGE